MQKVEPRGALPGDLPRLSSKTRARFGHPRVMQIKGLRVQARRLTASCLLMQSLPRQGSPWQEPETPRANPNCTRARNDPPTKNQLKINHIRAFGFGSVALCPPKIGIT